MAKWLSKHSERKRLIVRRSHRITAVFSLPIIPTQLHPDLMLYTETGSHVARRRSFHGSGVTYAANRWLRVEVGWYIENITILQMQLNDSLV